MKTIGILEAAAAGNGSVTTDVEGSLVRRVPMLTLREVIGIDSPMANAERTMVVL